MKKSNQLSTIKDLERIWEQSFIDHIAEDVDHEIRERRIIKRMNDYIIGEKKRNGNDIFKAIGKIKKKTVKKLRRLIRKIDTSVINYRKLKEAAKYCYILNQCTKRLLPFNKKDFELALEEHNFYNDVLNDLCGSREQRMRGQVCIRKYFGTFQRTKRAVKQVNVKFKNVIQQIDLKSRINNLKTDISHPRTSKAIPKLIALTAFFLILGVSMTYLSAPQKNMQNMAFFLIGMVPEQQDPLVDYLTSLQDDGGGFALEEEAVTLETSYRVLECLKLYGYLDTNGRLPIGFNRDKLIDWVMDCWQVEGGFSNDGEGIPDIKSTAEALVILRSLQAVDELHSIRDVAYEKIKEMIGGRIIWNRMMEENMEDQFWAVIAVKALDPIRGLSEIGLSYLKLDQTYSESQKDQQGISWLDDGSVKMVWGEEFFLDNESLSIIQPYAENLDRLFYAVNLIKELIQNPKETETIFSMLLDREVLKEQILAEGNIKGDGTFDSVRDAFHVTNALNTLGMAQSK